jgi:hypothetical protein
MTAPEVRPSRRERRTEDDDEKLETEDQEADADRGPHGETTTCGST